ncbi:helix-turn-helix transcriptional regulator [Pseudomaricurvus alkylphenolicus]|uniref:helix-turn-helix transcriptional regulator n=1 Tax=Pseudomaricurvus alkylphenolicus TaxID=1306991 RepID=UPI001420C938|nr:AraC family transcriptional regulator [Pseudomaricurvus alkylphenolicus]NIB40910.1 helix-turn-helix transcriptional regulator [Pseudomaricurvus alkylphenolicus]
MAEEYLNLPYTDLSRFDLKSGQKSIHHTHGDGAGDEILFQFQPGMMVRILDLHDVAAGEDSLRMPGGKVMIVCKLEGDSTLSRADEEEMALHAGSLWVCYSDHDLDIVETSDGQGRYLLVMLVCEPEVFTQEPFDLDIVQLPESLQRAIAGEESVAERYSISSGLARSLRNLLEGLGHSVWNRAFLQAKTVEIACVAVRNILDEELQKQRAHISAREIKIINRAAQVLQEQWQRPPSLDDLVKLLGIGKSRLTCCFKMIHGCTIGGFILNVKMLHAQALLAEGQLNITQVALEVGYEHASNFASAFKRHTGMTPKLYQKSVLNLLPNH